MYCACSFMCLCSLCSFCRSGGFILCLALHCISICSWWLIPRPNHHVWHHRLWSLLQYCNCFPRRTCTIVFIISRSFAMHHILWISRAQPNFTRNEGATMGVEEQRVSLCGQ
ncbi:hypothetical protein BC835DRAFT_314857 [Cytidiella melzeri]|nr:hypothetical protein BC835DRAFT_314857 [Cytidiella melzeri]